MTAQADFRSNDRDGNLVSEFWTADVFALYGLVPVVGGRPALPEDTTDSTSIIKLIQPSVAGADGRSRAWSYGNVTFAASIVQGSAKSGYVFRAFDVHGDEPLLTDTDGNALYGAVHHASRFAVMACPLTLAVAKDVYFVDQDNVIWAKELPADYRVDFWPSGPHESFSLVRGTGSADLDDARRFTARPAEVGARSMD